MVDTLDRTPEQLLGDAPVCTGRDYYNEKRNIIVVADRYESKWGGGDITENRCVYADFAVEGYHFFFLGYNDNVLNITYDHTLAFDSKENAPRLCEAILNKVIKHEFFDGYFGRKFLERLPDILNYTLPKAYYGLECGADMNMRGNYD